MEGDLIEDPAIVLNLRDAGCSRESIERFLRLSESGRAEDGARLLAGQRGRLLRMIHRDQKMLDNLDYLIFRLKKHKEETK